MRWISGGQSGTRRAFKAALAIARSSHDPDAIIPAANEALSLLAQFPAWPFWMLSERRVEAGLHFYLAMAYGRLCARDPARYAELAVQEIDAALAQTRPGDGRDWPAVLMNAGIAYSDRLQGDPVENNRRALAFLERALEAVDRRAEPGLWARIHGNIAAILPRYGPGDPESNQEAALEHQQAMVSGVSRERDPALWALAASQLGQLYLHGASGSRAENSETAIGHIEAALAVGAHHLDPTQRGHMLSDLMDAYAGRATGVPEENFEAAMALGRQAEALLDPAQVPILWGTLQMSIALLWFSRRHGQHTENLVRAEDHVRRALTVFTPEAFPAKHEQAHEVLRMIDMDRSGPSGAADAIASAIVATRNGLDAIDRETNYAGSIIETLSLVEQLLNDRAPASIEASIEEAIARCRELLELLPPGAMRTSATVSLGHAYGMRLRESRAGNLEQAIALLEAALADLDPRHDAGAWLNALESLAQCYQERLTGSAADNEEKALALAEKGLVVATSMRFPRVRTRLLRLLARVQVHRLRGDANANLRAALAAYREARCLYDEAGDRDSAAAVHFAALDVHHRLQGADPAPEAQAADGDAPAPFDARAFIQNLERMAKGIDPEADLKSWAQCTSDLAIWYIRIGPRGLTDADADLDLDAIAINCSRAIALYRTVIDRLSPSAHQHLWIETLRRISHAARVMHLSADWRRVATPNEAYDAQEVEQGAEIASAALEEAAAAMRQLLVAQPLLDMPRERLTDSVRLGELECLLGNWVSAHKAFQSAASAAAFLLADVEINDAELHRTLGEMAELASLAPIAAIEAEDLRAALTIAEIARARLLAKSLSLRALPLPDAERARMEEIQHAIRAQEDRLSSDLLVNRSGPLDEVMRLRAQLRALILSGNAPAEDPHQAVDDAIAEICADGSVLVFPFVAARGGWIAIAWLRDGEVALRACRADADHVLDGLFRFGVRGEYRSWQESFNAYRSPRGSEKVWNEALGTAAALLGQAIHAPLEELLTSAGLADRRRLRLLPHGMLGHLPIGIGTKQAGGAALLERFELSYIPSLYVLRQATTRARSSPRPERIAAFGAVEALDPRRRLPMARSEVEMAASWFAPSAAAALTNERHGKSDLIAALDSADIWHFATHGRFDAAAPGRSGLELRAGELLTIDEISSVTSLRPPRLVVLSACETGLYGLETLPNEFVGLPSAFLQAGALGVIATLWPVRDLPTSILLGRFYEGFVGQGLGAGEALRAAQLWLRDSDVDELTRAIERWRCEGRLDDSVADDVEKRLLSLAGTIGRAAPLASRSFWGGFIYSGI